MPRDHPVNLLTHNTFSLSPDAQEEKAQVQAKAEELEDFCTQALDELDGAKAEIATLQGRNG